MCSMFQYLHKRALGFYMDTYCLPGFHGITGHNGTDGLPGPKGDAGLQGRRGKRGERLPNSASRRLLVINVRMACDDQLCKWDRLLVTMKNIQN